MKILAACGNDCSVCPRYTALPYEKTGEELQHTAELWMKIGYRDHVVTNDEIACSGCRPDMFRLQTGEPVQVPRDKVLCRKGNKDLRSLSRISV